MKPQKGRKMKDGSNPLMFFFFFFFFYANSITLFNMKIRHFLTFDPSQIMASFRWRAVTKCFY